MNGYSQKVMAAPGPIDSDGNREDGIFLYVLNVKEIKPTEVRYIKVWRIKNNSLYNKLESTVLPNSKNKPEREPFEDHLKKHDEAYYNKINSIKPNNFFKTLIIRDNLHRSQTDLTRIVCAKE